MAVKNGMCVFMYRPSLGQPATKSMAGVGQRVREVFQQFKPRRRARDGTTKAGWPGFGGVINPSCWDGTMLLFIVQPGCTSMYTKKEWADVRCKQS